MTDAQAHFESKDAESTRLLLERVLRTFVSDPDAVRVQASQSEDGTVFTVRVAPADLSKVIGNDRRTIQALRMILGAVGLRRNSHFSIDIEETPG